MSEDFGVRKFSKLLKILFKNFSFLHGVSWVFFIRKGLGRLCSVVVVGCGDEVEIL